MIEKKGLRTILLTLLFSLFTTSLFSIEEYVSAVYKEIDVIFVEQSDEDLQDVLRRNIEDKYYYLMENYTKKKVRRLIIDNEYEFAMSAIYIIIDNNIDGDFEDEDAVDLYTTIAEAYEIQQAYEIEQQKKQEAILAKQAAEKEKLRTVVEKDYTVATTTEGKQVYISAKDEVSENYHWNANFGMIDFGATTVQDVNSMSDGISLDVDYAYKVPGKLSIGGDIFFDFKFMQFNNGPMELDFEIAPKVSFNALSDKLFFKLGFTNLSILKNKANSTKANTKQLEIQSKLGDNIPSPIAGIELNNVQIGSAKLTLGANYLFSSLLSQGEYQAFNGKANISVPFAELERVNLLFNFGVRDTFILYKGTGPENHLSVLLGFGVENVIR